MTGADVWLWAALALAVINLALLLVLLLRGPRRPADVATREELQQWAGVTPALRIELPLATAGGCGGSTGCC